MGMPLTESMYYILLSLINPNHGYGIMQQVEEMTEGRVTLGAGTLYGALNTLLDKKWIALYSADEESRKKKEYVITGYGLAVLNDEIIRLEELLNNGRKVTRNV
jgi:DNA-binding PadR family transcriptional regulator